MEQIVLEKGISALPTPDGEGEDGNGVNAFIYRGKKMDEIQERWGRINCCLKVIKNREGFHKNPANHYWGPAGGGKGTPITEASHIQNIYARHDLAPRVYALLKVKIKGKRHWAQLTDDLGHWEVEHNKQTELMKGPMKEIAEEYDIEMFNDGRDHNVVAGKYVDFQGFRLGESYDEKLKKRVSGVANVGKWGPWENYQPIKELGIGGGRKTKHRINRLGLKKMDFKGKTVLDIGCSEGVFCHYAEKRGAKRVVGMDLPGVVKPLWELASYLGYYNIDFLGIDLKGTAIPTGEFDIVLFLSMVHHIGLPEWVLDSTKGTLVFEGNGKNEDEHTIAKLNKTFKTVERIGETTDLFNRPIVWAKR